MRLRRKPRKQPVVVTNGSVLLDEKSQDDYQRMFGDRYVYVQWQPQVPSRHERRGAARRQRLRNDGRARDYVSCGQRRG